MKKLISLIVLSLVVLTACGQNETSSTNSNEDVDYSGTYLGYSWKGEADGVTLEEAKQKIETELTLDSEGVITDANMLFFKKDSEGNWYTRTDTKAEVEVDFNKTPTLATLESEDQDYVAGESLFEIETADMMAFYAVEVNDDRTAALAIVEPYTRYLFEFKMDNTFDYTTKFKDMTIGNGLVVPTTRTSTSGYIKPDNWDEYSDFNVLSFDAPYVLTGQGVFEGLTEESTIKEYLERTGVTFEDNVPVEMETTYGFTGIGGWNGNYNAIADYLIGKKATEVTSLIDWSIERYNKGINEENFFGVDVQSGATKTVQNSADTISGATVRMSRESTTYQRALIEAGILSEKDIIKGRF